MRDDQILAMMPPFTEKFSMADIAALSWQYGHHGSFYTALWNAIKAADHINLERLRTGFPQEVQGYINWTQGDLYERWEAYKREVSENDN